VRKALLLLIVLAALGAAGSAAAANGKGGGNEPTPGVTCANCLGGGGFTGCSSVSVQHSFSFTFIASVKHVLIVNYCKQNGYITSLSIAAHYCDVGGVMTCTPTVAWRTGGGVGSTSATYEAHATWSVSALSIYNNTDVLHLTVPAG